MRSKLNDTHYPLLVVPSLSIVLLVDILHILHQILCKNNNDTVNISLLYNKGKYFDLILLIELASLCLRV